MNLLILLFGMTGCTERIEIEYKPQACTLAIEQEQVVNVNVIVVDNRRDRKSVGLEKTSME